MKNETKRVKIIGLGGIGKALVEPLLRYLSFEYEEVQATLLDGDSYEEKNSNRQSFTVCGNKASVTVSELAPLLPRVNFRAKKTYITAENAINEIRDGDTVFLCVDNHATRKIVSDRCEELDNVTLISGGNDYTDGNVVLYRRVDGEDIGQPMTQMFPEIAKPEDQHPTETQNAEGCEVQTQTNPQLIFTNALIAARMNCVFYAVEQGKAIYKQVFDDALTQRARPVYIQACLPLTQKDEI